MSHSDVASIRRTPGPKVMPRGLLQFIILRLLHERPCAGAEVSSEIYARSRRTWRPSPGSLYPAIALLRQRGLITEIDTAGGVKRYALTDAGRAFLGAHMDDLSLRPPWLDLLSSFGVSGLETRPGAGDLWEGWRLMIQSVGQIAAAASLDPDAARHARTILEHAAGALKVLTAAPDRVGAPLSGPAPDSGPGAPVDAPPGAGSDTVVVPVAPPETALPTHPRS
jgi:DNA-binding PadR family transcriptional regulator